MLFQGTEHVYVVSSFAIFQNYPKIRSEISICDLYILGARFLHQFCYQANRITPLHLIFDYQVKNSNDVTPVQ